MGPALFPVLEDPCDPACHILPYSQGAEKRTVYPAKGQRHQEKNRQGYHGTAECAHDRRTELCLEDHPADGAAAFADEDERKGDEHYPDTGENYPKDSRLLQWIRFLFHYKDNSVLG
jgi:hypothetical protein